MCLCIIVTQFFLIILGLKGIHFLDILSDKIIVLNTSSFIVLKSLIALVFTEDKIKDLISDPNATDSRGLKIMPV